MTRALRRLGVGLLGGAIVIVGVVMIVAPGPGLVLIPAGLGVLALEFDRAGRLQRRLLHRIARLREGWASRRRSPL